MSGKPRRKSDKALAKDKREARIRVLTACNCTWPIKEHDTECGHAEDCPGRTEWLTQFG